MALSPARGSARNARLRLSDRFGAGPLSDQRPCPLSALLRSPDFSQYVQWLKDKMMRSARKRRADDVYPFGQSSKKVTPAAQNFYEQAKFSTRLQFGTQYGESSLQITFGTLSFVQALHERFQPA